jgi:hypothetical protein
METKGSQISTQILEELSTKFKNLNLFDCQGKRAQLFLSPKVDYQTLLQDISNQNIDNQM